MQQRQQENLHHEQKFYTPVEELKWLVQSVGWNQTMASEALGCSKAIISRYWSGAQEIPGHRMALLRLKVAEARTHRDSTYPDPAGGGSLILDGDDQKPSVFRRGSEGAKTTIAEGLVRMIKPHLDRGDNDAAYRVAVLLVQTLKPDSERKDKHE